ncbi:MAG: PsbP-related protein [Candidatus ainarchaeum sp.]|nr:PsbP-related protein [Candidatus ainarchaeum sp.]
MKIKILLFGFVIFAVLFSGCTQPVKNGVTSQNADGSFTYQNSSYGFKISYPQDWALRDESNNAFGNFDVSFSSKSGSSEIIGIQVFSSSYSPEELDSTVSEMSQAITLGGAKIQSTEPFKIANSPAKKVVSSNQGDSRIIKSTNIFTIKNGKLYLIKYVAPEQAYEANKEKTQKIIDSFEFIALN